MSVAGLSFMTAPHTDEVLTLDEAAAYLRVSEDGLRRLASEGMLPGQKIGEEWRFLKAALHDWLRYGPHQPGESFRMGPPWLCAYPPVEELVAVVERQVLAKLTTAEEPSDFKRGSKQRLLEVAGMWKDDESIHDLLAEIYKRRGRPMTEGEE